MKQDDKDTEHLFQKSPIAALPLLVTACLGADDGDAAPSVKITSPMNGATVTLEVDVEIYATNLGDGVLHLLIDQDPVPTGEMIEALPYRAVLPADARRIVVMLEAGDHRLTVQASTPEGIAIGSPDSVKIHVREEVDVEPHVFFTSPEDGDAVTTRFEVEMEASDFLIEVATGEVKDHAGHFFVAVDGVPPEVGESVEDRPNVKNYALGETRATLEISRGMHVLVLGLADGRNLALAPRDRIEIYGY
ncbi:MAG: DUF4399 domain-containing protein [Myxococcota bacterium]